MQTLEDFEFLSNYGRIDHSDNKVNDMWEVKAGLPPPALRKAGQPECQRYEDWGTDGLRCGRGSNFCPQMAMFCWSCTDFDRFKGISKRHRKMSQQGLWQYVGQLRTKIGTSCQKQDGWQPYVQKLSTYFSTNSAKWPVHCDVPAAGTHSTYLLKQIIAAN